MKKLMMIVAFAGAIAVPATFAQDAAARDREANQKARDKQGVASGEITRKEGAGLAKDQRRINRQINRADANGTMTPQKKARINREQTSESRNIYKDKHNAVTQK
jgi:Ni/Co efflux regulator RcnB